MWGWKSVERLIEPSVSLAQAKEILQAQGFQIHTSNPHHAVFKSAGTENPWTTLAPSGENVPIELAISESQRGLYLHLRYETFCLFDTGDLDRFANELAACMEKQHNAV